MIKKLMILTITISAFLLAAGCSKKPEQTTKTSTTAEKPAGSILAEVEDKAITVDEYTDRIMKMPLKLRKKIIGKEGKQKALDDMIKEELLFKAALKKGYDQNAKVVEELEKIKRGLILQTFVGELLQQDIQVSEEKIVEYYQENKEDFDRKEMVKASHIVVNSEDGAQKILTDIKQGKDFAELAKKHSNDATSAWKGGDLGYFPRGKMSAEFDEVAFALKEGEISDVVKDVYGYHIIKVTGKIPFIESTLSPSVKANIQRKFVREAQEEIINNYVDELKTQYKVSTKEEVLDSVIIPQYSPGGHGSRMGSGGGHGSFKSTGGRGAH